MGLQWSALNIISGAMGGEVTTREHREDGTVKKSQTRRKNPWVSIVSILSATTLLLVYLDGGRGTLSQVFGKVCATCVKK